MKGKKDYSAITREELIEMLEKCENEIERLNGVLGLVFKGNFLLEEKLKKHTIYEKGESFNQKWSWVSKIVYAVEHAGRLVRSSEIVEFLHSINYDCLYMTQEKTARYVSVYIQRAVEYKRIIAYKIPGLKAQYYGLPEWFKEDGGVKSEYQFNPHFK